VIPAAAITAFNIAGSRTAAEAPKAQRRQLRISLRDPQPERTVKFAEKLRRSGTCRTTRFAAFERRMEATPLSTLIAAGVNASTSEIRAPVHWRSGKTASRDGR